MNRTNATYAQSMTPREANTLAYRTFGADPTCKRLQSRYFRCGSTSKPYGEIEYLFKCAPHAEFDIKFHTGGHFQGFDGYPCQRYLTEACANNWNETCQAFAMNDEPSRFPDVNPIPPSSFKYPLNRGQQFMRSVLVEKYGVFEGFSSTPSLLDPNDPNSPIIHSRAPAQYGARIVMTKVPTSDPMYDVARQVGGSDDLLM